MRDYDECYCRDNGDLPGGVVPVDLERDFSSSGRVVLDVAGELFRSGFVTVNLLAVGGGSNGLGGGLGGGLGARLPAAEGGWKKNLGCGGGHTFGGGVGAMPPPAPLLPLPLLP